MKSSKQTAVLFLVLSNFLNMKYCYQREEGGGRLNKSPEQESVDWRCEVVAECGESGLQLLSVDTAGLVPGRKRFGLWLVYLSAILTCQKT